MKEQPWTLSVTTVSIDYPQEKERVNPGHYAIRISGLPEKQQVELSINEGDWQACRTAAGHHWLDWTPCKPGNVKLVVRFRAEGGSWKESSVRSCLVAERKDPQGAKGPILKATGSFGGLLRRNN